MKETCKENKFSSPVLQNINILAHFVFPNWKKLRTSKVAESNDSPVAINPYLLSFDMFNNEGKQLIVFVCL